MSPYGQPQPDLESHATNARVTPQELVKAIAALEAQRHTGRPHHDDTIRLGDAIEQLGLDVSPQELLREVHTYRATQNPAPPDTGSALNPRILLMSVAATLVLISTALCAQLILLPHPIATEARVMTMQTPGASVELYAPTAPDKTWNVAPEISVEPAPTAVTPAPATPTDGKFFAISQLQDNDRADVDFASLVKVAGGDETVKVSHDLPFDDALWTVQRKDGALQVYCYAKPSDAASAVNGRRTHVYASAHEDEGMMEFLVPVSAFQSASVVEESSHAGAIININAGL